MRESYDRFVMATSRWSNSAITPLRFDSRDDMAKDKMFLGPGWGKRPEMLRFIMRELVGRGTMPIAFDTRFGYAHAPPAVGLRSQQYKVDAQNPAFPNASAWDNRYELRRPTAVLALITGIEKTYDAQIDEISLFGHSESGRIMARVAIAPGNRYNVLRLVVANSVGIGEVMGLSSQIRSNLSSNELFSGESFGLLKEAIPSALESTAYALSHPRRWLREKAVISTANIWGALDAAAEKGTTVTVLHAADDLAIGFGAAQRQAQDWPRINFETTEGGHSNIYTLPMATKIADRLVA